MNETNAHNYIAVIDSGVGGISVLAEARKMMPEENYLFFADKANAPYGDRSTEEVDALMEEHCDRFIQNGAKAILIACNTATSASAKNLREIFSIPVLGMEPALKPAVTNIDGQILVLATSLTIHGEKFHKLFETYAEGKDVVPLACSGLMDLIEKDPDGSATEEYLMDLLAPYRPTMKAIVLGCTHYVFLRRMLSRIAPGVQLFDGNYGVCNHLRDILTSNNQLGGEGQLRWDCSLTDPEEKYAYLEKCRTLYTYYY